MFTGIVEATGTVARVRRRGDAAQVTVRSDAMQGTPHGASIAVDGVCLTVTDAGGVTEGEFTVDVMGETLRCTIMGALNEGSRVNLERAMAPTGRLDGHVVTGHVDGVGRVRDRADHDEWRTLTFECPVVLATHLVAKGSITVCGVSLTVTDVSEPGADPAWFSVGLIPTTLSHTTLGQMVIGDAVNLETDIIGKYVERIMAVRNVPVC